MNRIEQLVFSISGEMVLILYLVWLALHAIAWIAVEITRLGWATRLKILRIIRQTEAEE